MASDKKKQIRYICNNCGASSVNSADLCEPSDKTADRKFCGAKSLDVCEEKRSAMEYRCFSCNSVSETPDFLCDPVRQNENNPKRSD